MLLTRPWWTRDSIAAQVSLKEGSTSGPVSSELGLAQHAKAVEDKGGTAESKDAQVAALRTSCCFACSRFVGRLMLNVQPEARTCLRRLCSPTRQAGRARQMSFQGHGCLRNTSPCDVWHHVEFEYSFGSLSPGTLVCCLTQRHFSLEEKLEEKQLLQRPSMSTSFKSPFCRSTRLEHFYT